MLAGSRRVLHAADAAAAGGPRPLRDAHRPVHPHLLPRRQVIPRAFRFIPFARFGSRFPPPRSLSLKCLPPRYSALVLLDDAT